MHIRIIRVIRNMKLFHKESKFKKFIKKPTTIAVVAILLLVTAVSAGKGIINKNGETNEQEEARNKEQVQTALIDLDSSVDSFIESVGTVKAETQIDVIATTRGTLKGLFFEVGDEVELNQTLASLFDASTLTNLNNARTNLSNSKNNLQATDRITTENIRQAELGVESAKQSVESAEIGLKSAKDNLANAQVLRDKGNADAKNSAVAAFNGYMNTVFTALDLVNNLIKVDNFSNTTLDPGLGAKNKDNLRQAKTAYVNTRTEHEKLKQENINANNVELKMKELVSTLNSGELMLARTIDLLEKSVATQNLPQTTIDAQKTLISTQRSGLITSLASAKATLQNLENQDLIEDQEIMALENAAQAAQTQLNLAQTALDNALISLGNTKQAKEQQLIGSQTNLDNAQGQLSLALTGASDLGIKAAISGTITGKYVEIGAEINPGQKIAQISKTKLLKIETSLPSEDIYRIKVGQKVIIGDGLEASISSIDPAADPITRKVKVEILFDNSQNELIQGTFVDVSIPAKKLEKTHSESVFIPLRTITTTQTESFVFVVEEGKAKKQIVTLGKTEGALIEVLQGLKNGDELIIDGGKNLEEGEEIEIIN